MLNQSKIIALIATQNPEAATKFYEQTLGLRLVADEPFAIVFDANGTMLRLQKVESFQPQPFTTLGWEVANIEATMAQLAEKGVQFEQFPGLPLDDHGIMTFAGGAKVAWFKDLDGNLLSLTQP